MAKREVRTAPANIVPLRIVPRTVPTVENHWLNEDEMSSVNAALQILDFARRGQIKGMVFALDMAEGKVIVDASGSCLRKPRMARGYAADIDDFLRERLKSF